MVGLLQLGLEDKVRSSSRLCEILGERNARHRFTEISQDIQLTSTLNDELKRKKS